MHSPRKGPRQSSALSQTVDLAESQVDLAESQVNRAESQVVNESGSFKVVVGVVVESSDFGSAP